MTSLKVIGRGSYGKDGEEDQKEGSVSPGVLPLYPHSEYSYTLTLHTLPPFHSHFVLLQPYIFTLHTITPLHPPPPLAHL